MTSAGTILAAPDRPDAATARLDVVGHDLYRDVHKGIRAELFAITGALGRLDRSDAERARRLEVRTRSLFLLLDAHAAHEDGVIGPELARLDPALDRRVRDEHDVLEARMAVIEACAARVAAGSDEVEVRRWYLAMASFTSDYLAHEATEELLVSPVLADGLGDGGVAALESAIVSLIQPDQFEGYLRLILPATTHAERLALVGGIRDGAPPEVFAGVLELAGQLLDGDELARLRVGLGA